ncbi:putative DNA ligase [Flexivirga endophytica]|uniref:Probable DNA ligase n=1 Tax=Flexivirga endophytica TaxID=1849103 RepID=A0A916T9Z6_9MICO|nr:ATP-dependent DNA ligase [Flexivirga endophytica]GGB35600.1 putative DNA ligase [Flexivirga endophytica]GHB43325.1 putative DNA ligase [Flexivirga endophytica]
MLVEQVITVSEAVRATRSRLAKRDAVAQLLRDATPDEVPLVASYLAGVLPQRRIGVGWRGLRDAPEAAPKASVTVREFDEVLTAVASVSGAGSVGQRKELLATLFGRLTAAEQRFATGLIQGELRQGAGDGVMLAAIARASAVPEPAIRRAVMLAGFTAPVAAASMTGGADAVAQIGLVVGRPVRPMLAGSAPDIGDAVDLAQHQQIETKLDGIRVQAHKVADEVRLFTRSLEDITDRLPEVVEIVRSLRAHTVVLDGEAIALDPDGRPLPFQVTSARTGSSADPQRLREQTPVTPKFFDVLHLEGADLIDRPLRERCRRLAQLVPDQWLVERAAVADEAQAREFFAQRVAGGDEGVVVKDLDSPYAAGRRGAGWVKVKPRHTLDLVVLAVEWGSGRRKGFLSNIHLGARDPETGGLVMLGKTFKGMTDEMLRWQTERFTELATDRGDWVVHVRPEQVVEIAFDGLQRSSRYPGGLALRFARVIRYRDDKTAEEADTIDTVRALAGQ